MSEQGGNTLEISEVCGWYWLHDIRVFLKATYIFFLPNSSPWNQPHRMGQLLGVIHSVALLRVTSLLFPTVIVLCRLSLMGLGRVVGVGSGAG